MVLKTFVSCTAARRLPLIKFRKGLPAVAEHTGHTASGSSASTNTNTFRAQSRGEPIEDWELPPRYWRKPMDAMEMDYINRGGPP